MPAERTAVSWKSTSDTVPEIDEGAGTTALAESRTVVGVRALLVALTVCNPLLPPRVQPTDARPWTSVSVVSCVTAPPPEATAHTIGTFARFWPVAVRTRTLIGAASVVPASAVWPLPAPAASVLPGLNAAEATAVANPLATCALSAWPLPTS